MNYYERIQNSLSYIEENLCNEITVENCAKEAYMSVSGYYRMFLSIVGHNVKEYIRERRLTLALSELKEPSGETVLSLAVKYYYNSADSFTRAFKKQFGVLPSRVRVLPDNTILHTTERINIMEKFFETENTELLEKYPDIKVIKSLPEQKAACFTYYGPEPEGHAFEVMKAFAKKMKISLHDSSYRVYGYNHPDPSDGEEVYGYEVCVTIPDELYETLPDVPADFTKGTYDGVKRRILGGGKYAVLSVKRGDDGDVGTNIMLAWKRFLLWMEEAKYVYGRNQYLEEHLGFDEADDHIGGVDLYLSVDTPPVMNASELTEKTLLPFRAVKFYIEGTNPEALPNECWGAALAFAKRYGLSSDKSSVFQYNNGFDRRPPFFHAILISLPEGFSEESCQKEVNRFGFDEGGVQISFTDVPGGRYMTKKTSRSGLVMSWQQMEQLRKDKKITGARHQWMEEWCLPDFSFPEKEITVYYPIATDKQVR